MINENKCKFSIEIKYEMHPLRHQQLYNLMNLWKLKTQIITNHLMILIWIKVLTVKSQGTINFIMPKLAGTLNRCKLSVRVLHVTLEALGCNIDDYVINQTSLHRSREIYRCERAKIIK